MGGHISVNVSVSQYSVDNLHELSGHVAMIDMNMS